MTTGVVVDTSAVVAILQSEDGHDVLTEHLAGAPRRLMSAATRVELGMVVEARYGEGRHPAALNFGDCFSYELAEDTGFPLLRAGDDFTATDLPTAGPTC